jgi:hypothetical protein
MKKKQPSTPSIQEILWDYTEWLHKLGYIDSDFYTEKPYAVDRYLEEKTDK